MTSGKILSVMILTFVGWVGTVILNRISADAIVSSAEKYNIDPSIEFTILITYISNALGLITLLLLFLFIFFKIRERRLEKWRYGSYNVGPY